MKIPNWLRKVPHPLYGNYGGRPRKCRGETCPLPVDKMDVLFMRHDADLYEANKKQSSIEKSRLRELADKNLAYGLRNEDDLKPYAQKIYGPIYNRMARLIFKT